MATNCLHTTGTWATTQVLRTLAQQHFLPVVTIASLINWRLRHEMSVRREAVSDLPTEFGEFKAYVYRNLLDRTEHVALVKGNPLSFRHRPIMVRVHSECLTGDVLGSLRCDCRAQLQAAMAMIARAGSGVVIYLRQEGRGIGLVNKLKAYALQDLGLDTVEANEKLGLEAGLRTYGVGGQMLQDMGVRNLCLLTNNPRKIAGLAEFGLNVIDRIPLVTGTTIHNAHYLSVKAQKLGHSLSEEGALTR